MKSVGRGALGCAAALAVLAGSTRAFADGTIAAGPLAPERPAPARSEHEPDIDAIGSVRFGLGYSELMRSRIWSVSFEDQFRVHRFSDLAAATLVFGLDGQHPIDAHPRERGFMAITLGPGLVLRDGDGPAFTLASTIAPLLQSRDDHTTLAGFGVGLRAEAYPFYQSLIESIQCRRGGFATYVLSGLHGWVQTRRDFIGTSGQSYAVGFGFDLGRQIVLPILGALLPGGCSSQEASAVRR